jgi:UDP-N-acetylglucosamine enolpyruvyl transferase
MQNLGAYLVVLVVGALIGASLVCFISINKNSISAEELKINSVSFLTSTSLIADVINTGTSDITITGVSISGSGVTEATIFPEKITAGTKASLEVTITGELVYGVTYSIAFISSEGNQFYFTSIF